ncbi:MAG: hypothetical protein IJM64_00845 [Ottowia sp.]|nr:hypothetical protein [Ottowia sp.]
MNTRNELAALYENGERIFSRDVHDITVDIFDYIRLQSEQDQVKAWQSFKEEGVHAIESEYKRVYNEYPQEHYDDAMELCSNVLFAIMLLSPKKQQNTMNTTLYMNTAAGSVATEAEWRADFAAGAFGEQTWEDAFAGLTEVVANTPDTPGYDAEYGEYRPA